MSNDKKTAYESIFIEMNLELKEALHKIRDLQWEMEWKDKKLAELIADERTDQEKDNDPSAELDKPYMRIVTKIHD